MSADKPFEVKLLAFEIRHKHAKHTQFLATLLVISELRTKPFWSEANKNNATNLAPNNDSNVTLLNQRNSSTFSKIHIIVCSLLRTNCSWPHSSVNKCKQINYILIVYENYHLAAHPNIYVITWARLCLSLPFLLKGDAEIRFWVFMM